MANGKNDTKLGWIQVGTVIAVVLGFLVNFYTTTREQPPSPPKPLLVPTQVQAAAGTELIATLLYQKKVRIEPTAASATVLTLEMRKLAPITDVRVKLLAPEGEEQVFIDRPPRKILASDLETWTWDLTLTHDGRVRTDTKNYNLEITYDLGGEKPVPNKTLGVQFSLVLDNRDFPFWSYFFMIASGVILSYVIAEGKKIRESLKKDFADAVVKPVGWLVLSLLLVPALYMQYRETVTQFDTAWINLIAALPFGAGVDFALGKAAAARA